MKLYTVQRTVLLTVDVEADTPEEAYDFVNGMGGSAFDTEELIEDRIIAESELEPA